MTVQGTFEETCTVYGAPTEPPPEITGPRRSVFGLLSTNLLVTHPGVPVHFLLVLPTSFHLPDIKVDLP